MSFRTKLLPYIPLLPILLLAFLIASPGLRAGFYADDWFQVLPRSPLEILRTFTGDWSTGTHTPGGLYRPLIRVTFGIDEWIWGSNPFGYHLTNMVMWLLLIAGVYTAGIVLTDGKKSHASFAAVFVTLFPTNAEAVTWLSGRTDLQAGCALIWAFVGLLWFLRTEKIRHLLLCLGLFMAALLTKEIAIAASAVLPLAILLLSPKTFSRWLWRVGIVAPIMIGIIYLIVRFASIGGLGGYHAERGRALTISELWHAAASQIAALGFPRWGLSEGFYSTTAAWGALLFLGLILVMGRFRRPVVFCFVAALLFLAPMAGLGVGGGMGGRMLLVPEMFVALGLASFAGLSLVGRVVKWPLLLVYLYVFLAWAADSLDAHLAWKRAWPANRDLMNQIVTQIESTSVPRQFAYEEPPFGEGNRLLVPGMTGALAVRTMWQWKGLQAYFEDPKPDEPYGILILELPDGGSHRLIPALAPPAGEGTLIFRGSPTGELEVFEVAVENEIRLVGPEVESAAIEVDGSTSFQVGEGGELSGYKLGPSGGILFGLDTTLSDLVLTGRARVDAGTGAVRIQQAQGESFTIPFSYPPDFWGTDVFAVRIPGISSGPVGLTWIPAPESVRFELDELTLHEYELTRLSDQEHAQQ
ncbi:hypothetical protein KQI84_15295 [bacterium]|nr:hypothetical protein [bacterium]